MKKLIIIIELIIITIFNQSYSQVTFWTEDFQSTTGADAYNGANGNWTLTTTGTNASEAGRWRVDTYETGMGPGFCGTDGGTDQSLYMGPSDAYNISIIAGAVFLFEPAGVTNKRIESPTIDCSGYNSITIEFDYLEGQSSLSDLDDDATLWYFDGSTWAQIDPIATTFPGCPMSHGVWTLFNTFTLPASAANNPNVKLGFNWTTDGDINGTNPSFAVDDIIIKGIVSSPSVNAVFGLSILPFICEGTSITFSDASTASGTTITSWDWVFDGGTPATANTQGPHSIVFNTAGNYNVSLTVSDGSVSNTSVVAITVYASANAGSDNAANLCNNTTLDLNTLLSGADPGGAWIETSFPSSGQFDMVNGIFNANGLTLGDVYTFDYTAQPIGAGTPCPTDFSTFTITIDCAGAILPTASFIPSATTICEGECITLTDGSSPNIISWFWDFNGGATNSTLQDPGSVCFNSAGTYNVTLTATNSNGSNTTIPTVITVNGLPNINANATPSTTICEGDQVTLTGTGALTYTWDNGVTNGVAITPTATTTYNVTGTDANNCINTDQITVTVMSYPIVNAGNDQTICEGESVQLIATGASTYQWSPVDGLSDPTINNPIFIAENTISYVVTAGTICTSTDVVVITVNPSPQAQASPDTTITPGEIVALQSDGGLTYSWTPTTALSCTDCQYPDATPDQSTTYCVVVTAANGCTDSSCVYLKVEFDCGGELFIPTLFSPNGDGMNDEMCVYGINENCINNYSFIIYNRWGEKVFESSEVNSCWDGSYHGKTLNTAVFVFSMQVVTSSGEVIKKSGNISLIR